MGAVVTLSLCRTAAVSWPSLPWAGTAFSTIANGLFAILASSIVVLMACRSNRWGRHGIRTKSAARAAGERCGFGIWGGVDDGKVGATSLGFLQNDRQAVRLCGHNGRGFPGANVAPSSSACLRIKVNDGCGFVVPLGRDRQVEREGSLPGAALLSYYRYSFHVHMYTRRRVD